MKLTDARFAYLLLIPILVANFLIIIYPLATSFVNSFLDINIYKGTADFVGLDNYIRLVGDSTVLKSTLTTFRFAIEGVLLAIVLAFGIALLLNEEFYGRTFLRIAVILPWAISEYSVAAMWKNILVQSYGPLNGFLYQVGLIQKHLTFLSPGHALDWLAVAWAWHWAPIGAFFLLASLQTIPLPLYSAARMDGAGVIRRFTKVIFPHMKYAFLIVTVFLTLEVLRAFDILYIMTGGGPGDLTKVLTLRIYEYYFEYSLYSYASAISYYLILIAFVVATVYFLILNKKS